MLLRTRFKLRGFPPPPRRIASLAPSVTETLYALGLNNTVVIVTMFCAYPPEVQKNRESPGLVKQDTSTVNDLSAFSYKARVKGCNDISVLYA